MINNAPFDILSEIIIACVVKFTPFLSNFNLLVRYETRIVKKYLLTNLVECKITRRNFVICFFWGRVLFRFVNFAYKKGSCC